MLPDIRAVVAAVAAAIGLLIIAFVVIATLRVAQESRAGSLHTDLARRGHATVPEPQPVVLIETPGPTLLARVPEVEPFPAAAAEQAPASTEPLAIEESRLPKRPPRSPRVRRSFRSRLSPMPTARILRRHRQRRRRACLLPRQSRRRSRLLHPRLSWLHRKSSRRSPTRPRPRRAWPRSAARLRRRSLRPKRSERQPSANACEKPPPRKERRLAPPGSPGSASSWRNAPPRPPSKQVHRASRADSPSPRPARSTARRSAAASTSAARPTGAELASCGALSEARHDAVAERDTRFMAEPPDHAAFTPAATGQHQREFVRQVRFRMQPRTAVGDVRDPAVARQRTGAAQYLAHASHCVTLRASPLFRLCSGFEFQHSGNSTPHAFLDPAWL